MDSYLRRLHHEQEQQAVHVLNMYAEMVSGSKQATPQGSQGAQEPPKRSAIPTMDEWLRGQG